MVTLVIYPARSRRPPIETTAKVKRESGSGTANQSCVNNPAGQWELGGEDVSLMLNPPPLLESCLEGPRGGVAGRGEGGQVELAQGKPVQRKIL